MKGKYLLVDKEILPECYLKVMEAKDLLMSGSCGIAETAEAVGFEDANYFSRVFKKHTGQSPSAFVRGVK